MAEPRWATETLSTSRHHSRFPRLFLLLLNLLCDRLDPVCSQCKRAGKPCGGYRDVPALLFRDENDKTARRSAVAKSRSEARRKLLDWSEDVSDSSSHGAGLCQSDSVDWSQTLQLALAPTLPKTVPSSVDDQGLKFFNHQFVTSIARIDEDVPYPLEISPFLSTLPDQSPLRNAVVSVGLAAMSNVTRDRSLLLVARERYVASINFVRSAVEFPEKANPDETLKTILMLSLYEMVCCTSNQIDSWTVHLDGVAALLKQASFGQAMRSINPGPQLQFHFISIVRYFLVQESFPTDLNNWSPDCILNAGLYEQPAILLIDILIRFMKLHSSVRQDSTLDHTTIVSSAQLFDDELNQWESQLTDKWLFTMKASNNLEHTFNGQYLAYSDVWTSRILNHYFLGRLLVSEMILFHLARLKSPTLEHLRLRQQALNTTSRIAINICAGAATQIGSIGFGVPPKLLSHLPPLNGVFMLIFPLAVAGSVAGAPVEVSQWVIQMLQRIGDTMGIKRALEIIPMIKQVRVRKIRELIDQEG
ncbi:hypothetical protein N7462_011152 [Penicillium macrosclerotiorum]|uniref:uncharacterized protein n=1 Tax=Penicillium macrosclerotiorum TaxID=303699 RepID=UPI0025485754|nr:uncharacterized protein N7462_011152 [Penicillium macrosclerotiorum]KAJ5666743.1 hypothetical protein N7462_011152 [Penicillium macrosclerotiorum]